MNSANGSEPFPPADEDPMNFGILRRNVGLSENCFVIKPDVFRDIINSGGPDSRRVEGYWKMGLCKTITHLFAIL